MKFKHFFASMLATAFLFFFTATAFATDPVKTDPGRTNSVSVASAEELGNFVRQNTQLVSFSNTTNTVTYESPQYNLAGNDLATNVSVTYNLSSGNVQTIFIVTKYRTGQQTLTIFPYEQEKTEVTTGPATPESMIMELNRINRLSQPNQYIQQSNSSGSTNEPSQTARSGSQTSQPKKLQK